MLAYVLRLIHHTYKTVLPIYKWTIKGLSEFDMHWSVYLFTVISFMLVLDVYGSFFVDAWLMNEVLVTSV